jgi:TetR/AcrR family transcriptional regulator, transcriptional repressor for nem operon
MQKSYKTSRGIRTREEIIEKAAPVFNRRGYIGTSMSDLMEATGLKKGGLYNHFENKDELAVEALLYAICILREAIGQAVHEEDSYTDQLLALFRVYENPLDPPIPGGCPILNTSVDCDDTHPGLLALAREAMTKFVALVEKLLVAGIECGEFKSQIHPHQVASFFAATLEGGIHMSRLFHDPLHMHHVVKSIEQFIQSNLLREP